MCRDPRDSCIGSQSTSVPAAFPSNDGKQDTFGFLKWNLSNYIEDIKSTAYNVLIRPTINAAVKDHLEPPLLKSSPLFTS